MSSVQASTLTSLNLSSNYIREPLNCLGSILKQSPLVSLDLSRNIIDFPEANSLVQSLSTCTTLTAFMINNNLCSDSFELPGDHRHITSRLVSLGWTFKQLVDPTLCQLLAESKFLTSLDFSFDDLTGSNEMLLLHGLAVCTRLTSLSLRFNYRGLDTYGAEHLGGLLTRSITNLSSLCLTAICLSPGPNVTKTIMAGVAANTRLTSLSLCSSALGVEGHRAVMEYLQGNTRLKFLDVRANAWGGSFGASVWRAQRCNPNMECISGVPVTTMRRRRQSCLYLPGLQLGPAEFVILEHQLKEAPMQFAYMELQDNMISGCVDRRAHVCVRRAIDTYDCGGLHALGRIISTQTDLHSINLSGNKLGSNGNSACVSSLAAFCSVLSACPHLHKLNLASNQLDAVSLLALIPLISNSRSLNVLDLSLNHLYHPFSAAQGESGVCVGPVGHLLAFRQLAETLRAGASLRHLNLACQEPTTLVSCLIISRNFSAFVESYTQVSELSNPLMVASCSVEW
jgi:Ran GTPase-activating protein (RanGAP) involved in mRNA processing and transport